MEVLCCPCGVTQYCVYAKTEVNMNTVFTEKPPQVVNTDAKCQSVPTKKQQQSVIEKLQGFTSVRHDRLVLARSFRMTSLCEDGDWTVLGHWKNSHLN